MSANRSGETNEKEETEMSNSNTVFFVQSQICTGEEEFARWLKSEQLSLERIATIDAVLHIEGCKQYLPVVAKDHTGAIMVYNDHAGGLNLYSKAYWQGKRTDGRPYYIAIQNDGKNKLLQMLERLLTAIDRG